MERKKPRLRAPENYQTHEIFEFMTSLRDKLAGDYLRISKRALEDPNTAGDEGEESWAEVLRAWLPATYPIATKGRILFENGEASPQVDILVLSPSYPIALRNKKYYFSGGVLAAFECKLRLRKSDLSKIVRTCAKIKQNGKRQDGTVFDDLFARPFFGILAHSSEWKKQPIFKLHDAFLDLTAQHTSNIWEAVDAGCIADSGFTRAVKDVVLERDADNETRKELKRYKVAAAVVLMYSTRDHEMANEKRPGIDSDALASLIQEISTSLAYEDVTLRPWVEHLQSLHSHSGIGKTLVADAKKVLATSTLARIQTSGFDPDGWSKWQQHVP